MIQLPKIFLARSLRDEYLEKIHTLAPDHQIVTELTPETLPDIEISLGWKLVLDSSPLKFVQTISAGVDYLPLDQLKEKHILLANGSGIHTHSIAEHVVGSLLAYARGLLPAAINQKKQLWDTDLPIIELKNKNMLIVGTGKIGTAIAKAAAAIGVNVFGVNTTGHPVEGFKETYSAQNLIKIVAGMDIIVNILPLTDKTQYLYGERMFAAMKKQPIFINVGRGKSVRTKDLIAALQDGTIRFAILDVFEEEPLPAADPLWQLENVFLTPHISGYTPDFQKKLMAIFLPNLQSYLENGTLVRNQVNLDKGY